MIAEKFYVHFAQNCLLVDEQKGCRKASRGTKDQLLIDKAILKNSRRRLTNLFMAWIDYRKAYDMFPHSSMDMVGVAGNVVAIIRNSMINWKKVLRSGVNDLGEVNIKRGIFQGYSLSPLLFVIIMLPLTLILCKMTAGHKMCKEMKVVNDLLFKDDLRLDAASKDQLDSLIQSVRIFSQDIRMSFELDKCAVLEMKRGRKQHSSWVEIPSVAFMSLRSGGCGYTYLGILQHDKLDNLC